VEKFTQRDVAAVVEYGRLRGVRVFPEFDVPGHAQSWCVGYPEICPSAQCNSPLNVANNSTFAVIDGILSECSGRARSAPGAPQGLFPDDFVHLGGDEVNTACWDKTPSVKTWLDERKMSADDGYAYFAQRAAQIALGHGRRPIQWSEVYDHFKTKLDKRTVVHIWKSNTNVTEVVANGYDTLVNVGYVADSWYLDNLNVNWTSVYRNDPCAGVPDDLCAAHVLGGHGEMWGETVDASDLQQTVWPRMAAIAERLWSPKAVTTDPVAALPRIEAFRCLLNRRGVDAAPVGNANARSAPSGPGSCLKQR
jgi:hexosaminidase